jgi:hypothetical protein
LALPTTTGVELAPGRYSSSPPFGVPFTFAVPDAAWRSGHLDEEFFDIQQFDVGNATILPSRWIAFARPARVRGDGDTSVEGLTVEAAVDLWGVRSDVTVSAESPFDLDGRAGRRIDLHADVNDTKLFGGPGGDFGLGPEHDTRLGVVPLDGGLLLVLVLAPRDELEHAWEIAAPILESVDLQVGH